VTDSVQTPSNTRPLILGTLSFAVCFAAWGLISAFAPRFREMLHLTGTQTAPLVAVPVLLGSLGRLPVGMIADRWTPPARQARALGVYGLGNMGQSAAVNRRVFLSREVAQERERPAEATRGAEALQSPTVHFQR
jgi:nitrate/nitrite transporter NarK